MQHAAKRQKKALLLVINLKKWVLEQLKDVEENERQREPPHSAMLGRLRVYIRQQVVFIHLN